MRRLGQAAMLGAWLGATSARAEPLSGDVGVSVGAVHSAAPVRASVGLTGVIRVDDGLGVQLRAGVAPLFEDTTWKITQGLVYVREQGGETGFGDGTSDSAARSRAAWRCRSRSRR